MKVPLLPVIFFSFNYLSSYLSISFSAVKAHEISPSVINIIKNEDNQIYFDTKKEFPLKKIMKKDKNIIICKDDIASYINVTSTEDEVIRRVRTGNTKASDYSVRVF